MQHTFIIADQDYEAWLSRRGSGYVLHAGERAVPVAMAPAQRGAQELTVDGQTFLVLVVADGDCVHIHVDGASFTVRYVDPVQRYGRHAGGATEDVAEAPMPGVVIAVHVDEGQNVELGDTLVVIESMKLETAIKAWRAGSVAAVHVEVGQTFQRGAPLLRLAPQGGA